MVPPPETDANSGLEDDWASYLPDLEGLEGNEPIPTTTTTNNDRQDSIDAGVDEEVKIRQIKKRPKLDEDRLLSENGLPFVRSRIAKKLKFKGKGHEYKDLCRIIEVYQLWAHKLFPKAKFRDFFMITEKLGHTRRLQEQRREWIDELKGSKDNTDGAAGESDRSAMPPQSTNLPTSLQRVEPNTDISNLVRDVDDLYEKLTGNMPSQTARPSNKEPPSPIRKSYNPSSGGLFVHENEIPLDDDAAWAALGDAAEEDLLLQNAYDDM